MLKINNLTVSADKKTILKDFSLDINNGEIVTLMGPNGIGKSTICKVIMGDPNYKVEKGSILYNNEDLLKMDICTRARKGIYLVSQNPVEIEGVTISEMLKSAKEARSEDHVDIFKFNKELTSYCETLGLEPSFVHREINVSMSGGEKKKCELLSLLVLKPNLIILDELDSGLDIDSLKNLSKIIKKYMDKSVSLLIVTHHDSILSYLKPDKVHVLMSGKIVETGDYSLAKRIEKDGFGYYDVSEKNKNE